MSARFPLASPILLAVLLLPAKVGAQLDSRCPETEARQFDFWLGAWDVENRQRNPQAAPDDTTLVATGTATDRVRAVLGGCAIVEHWYGELAHATQRGTSVRAWDPTLGRWVLWLAWPGPTGVGFSRLEGAFADGLGTFTREGTGAQGPFTVRFTFSDIAEDSFVWTGAFAPAGGSWTRFWVMDFTRRGGAGALGPFNGMAEATEACPDEPARAFDFLVGEWRSEDGAATLRARTILDGCALSQEEEWTEAGERWSRYQVRARETSTGAWAMIAIDDRDRSFSRWAAVEPEAPLQFQREVGGEVRRLRYENVGSDRFTRVRERSTDGGRTWTTMERLGFRRAAS